MTVIFVGRQAPLEHEENEYLLCPPTEAFETKFCREREGTIFHLP